MISGLFYSQFSVVLTALKFCMIYGIMDGARWPQLALVIFSMIGMGCGIMERVTGKDGAWTDFSFTLLTGGIINIVLYMLLISKSATEWRKSNKK